MLEQLTPDIDICVIGGDIYIHTKDFIPQLLIKPLIL